jgi:Peptidase A4 family
MSHSIMRLAALGVTAVAALALAAAPASAVPTSHTAALTAAHHRLAFAPARGVRIGSPMQARPTARNGFNEDGQNWSGYAATGSGFTSVTSSWTEPAVTCNSTNDLFAPWVGIDGYGSSTVEQTGVATDCSSGSPVSQGWYEMYPAAPVYYDNPTAAGDQITATVTRSGTSYTLTLADTTQGWTKTTTKTLSATNASVEVIMESPTGAYPNFGTVNFAGSTVNGGPLGNTGPVALDASNSSGFEDHTSALSGGTNFSIAYEQE